MAAEWVLEVTVCPRLHRSHTSLRLGGGAGDYVSTQNDPFDIRFTFSLAACLALDKWTDGEQNLVSQAPGVGLDAGGRRRYDILTVP